MPSVWDVWVMLVMLGQGPQAPAVPLACASCAQGTAPACPVCHESSDFLWEGSCEDPLLVWDSFPEVQQLQMWGLECPPFASLHPETFARDHSWSCADVLSGDNSPAP